MSAAGFQILPGLPAYGPPAEPFPANGNVAYREGVVVRFKAQNGDDWVGNFQPGFGGYTGVFETFGEDCPVVIAEGAAYVVDTATRRSIEEFGASIDWCLELPGQSRLIFADGIGFEARDRNGVVWRSDRVSWDGMRDLTLRDGKVHGFAYSPIDDDYKSFDLDLSTGKFGGGSYR